MNPQTEELMRNLQLLADRSESGEIRWDQTSSTTFQWVRDSLNDPMIVTIQKATEPRSAESLLTLAAVPTDSYLFQIHGKALASKPLVTLSSKERPEFRKILRELYLNIEKGVDAYSSNVLKNLLGGKK